MDATDLLEPVLGNGIRLTNFFNGRILTAEDLRTDQQGNRAQHRQLARALGEGVAHGLEVAAATPAGGAPALSIQPGLALNRDGDAVALGKAIELRLVTAREAANAEAGLFAVCQARSDPLELTNVGLYVLTACPASGLSGERAPMAEFGSEGVAGSCASRWALEGVRFSVAPLPLAPAGEAPGALATGLAALVEEVEENLDLVLRGGASDTPAVRTALDRALSKLRNGAAYLCFGVDRLAALRAVPLTEAGGFPEPAYGAVDGMRERKELAACEVPLALFFLSRRGVEWVDAWAVRRPVVPALSAGTLALLFDRRREAESRAMLLQFQQHAADLMKSSLSKSALTLVRAGDYFRYLPPVGVLPVLRPGASRGFTSAAFLKGFFSPSPVQVDGAHLEAAVRDALAGPPLDLSQKGAVVVYRARENLPAEDGTLPGQPYEVFVNRDAQRPREKDGVTLVFQQAALVYRGVVKRRLFIPLDAGNDASAARVTVPAAVQDVTGTALQLATLAAAGRLPTRDALDAFLQLHAVQDELAGVLLAMSTLPNALDRNAFATQLRTLLNVTGAAGTPALRTAAQQRDLPGAVKAQEGINQLVGTWSGEGLAMGFIDVSYVSSPDGDTLALGSMQAFEYRFAVANLTDKTLALELEALVTAAAGDWTGLATVRGTRGGSTITQLTLAPDAAADVFVAVRVPPGAQAGPATLSLTANAGTLQNKTDTAVRALTVGSGPTAPVTRSVQIVGIVPTPASAQVTVGAVRSYEVTLLYNAEEGPSTAQFNLRLVATGASGAAVNEWGVSFFGESAPAATVGAVRTAATLRTLTSGVTAANTASARMRAPTVGSPSPKAVQVQLLVESVNLDPAVSAQSSTWTLTLPGS
jgi:hypothetical protein